MKQYLLLLATLSSIKAGGIQEKLNIALLKDGGDNGILANIDESNSRHLAEKIISQYNVSTDQYTVKVSSDDGRHLEEKLISSEQVPSDKYTVKIAEESGRHLEENLNIPESVHREKAVDTAPQGRGLSTTSSYEPSDFAGLRISLKSNAFGNYMRSDNAISSSVNSQTYVGDWEKWYLVLNSDGSYSLKSAFGWYVSVRGSGAYQLVKQMSAIGAWEKFSITNSNGVWCIKSNAWGNYLRMSASGYNKNVNTQTSCGDWEKWVPELQLTATSISITYNTDLATVVTGNPMSLATNVVNNTAGSVAQSITYTVAKTITSTNTFSQTKGISLTQTVEVSVGVPNVASEKVSLSATEKFEETYGTSNSESYTFTSAFPLVVPAGKIYKGVASVYSSSFNIPYTAIVYYAETTVTSTLSGTYSGVAYYSLFYTVYDITS